MNFNSAQRHDKTVNAVFFETFCTTTNV